MRAGLPLVKAGAVLALLCMTTAGAVATETGVSINIVDVPRSQEKWGYAPQTRTVDVGTWVTWSNGGENSHTVTAVDGSFDSGNLDPSEGFSEYFDTPGTFRYSCAWHPWMVGRIVVSPGAGLDPNQQ